jgi:hypothetical protein
MAVGLPLSAPGVVVERFHNATSAAMTERVDRAIDEGALDVRVRDIAQRVTRELDWRDQTGAALRLLRWVQARIRYAEDPAGADVVQLADYTLDHRSGDCVAQTVLLGSLLRARGIASRPLYVDPDGMGINHVLLLVEPSDGPPFTVDPIDYAAAPGYIPDGRLFLSRGDGRALPTERASMLAVATRPARRMGYLRAIGQTSDEAEKQAAAEAAEVDYLKLGLGGAFGAMAASLIKQGQGATLDPKTGQVVYKGTPTPPAAPMNGTVFGLPVVALVGLAVLLFFMLRKRKRA